MALNMTIFIDNKEDLIQKTLSIIEISKDLEQIKYYIKKYNIPNDIFESSNILNKKLSKGEISFRVYDELTIDNYSKYL